MEVFATWSACRKMGRHTWEAFGCVAAAGNQVGIHVQDLAPLHMRLAHAGGMSTTKSNDDPSERSTGRHPEVARWESVVVSRGEAVVPAWLRPHRGEQRWSVLGVVTVAIALQVLLPDEFVLRPRTAAPVLEAL